jgi:hypothetical protein
MTVKYFASSNTPVVCMCLLQLCAHQFAALERTGTSTLEQHKDIARILTDPKKRFRCIPVACLDRLSCTWNCVRYLRHLGRGRSLSLLTRSGIQLMLLRAAWSKRCAALTLDPVCVFVCLCVCVCVCVCAPGVPYTTDVTPSCLLKALRCTDTRSCMWVCEYLCFMCLCAYIHLCTLILGRPCLALTLDAVGVCICACYVCACAYIHTWNRCFALALDYVWMYCLCVYVNTCILGLVCVYVLYVRLCVRLCVSAPLPLNVVG